MVRATIQRRAPRHRGRPRVRDVNAYHRARRHDEAANRISVASWNRAVWWRLPLGHGRTIAVTRNQAYERAAKRSDVTFITIKDYRRFRDVGLLGLDVDGNERVGARDRNGSRNALFADLLITTGAPS
jgi:hypothetical protein